MQSPVLCTDELTGKGRAHRGRPCHAAQDHRPVRRNGAQPAHSKEVKPTRSQITENVHLINKNASSPRLKFVMESLVTHLHNFARDVQLKDDEWMAALNFLVRVGQISSDIRHEGILLSDVLGLSLLVDSLSHPKPEGCTESTVLGPFETEDCPERAAGESIASEGKGEYMYVSGRLTNTKGEPVPNAEIDGVSRLFSWLALAHKRTVWETDDKGLYDTQYSDRKVPDCRGKVHSDAEGYYSFRGVGAFIKLLAA